MAVLGLGWLAGKLGLSGRWQLAAAFGSGVIIGAAFQIASVGIPKTFTEWFYVGITGIIMGLMPSGFYEALKSSAHKAAAWWLDKNEPNPPSPLPLQGRGKEGDHGSTLRTWRYHRSGLSGCAGAWPVQECWA